MRQGHIDLEATYLITGADLAHLTKEAYELLTRHRPGTAQHRTGNVIKAICDRAVKVEEC